MNILDLSAEAAVVNLSDSIAERELAVIGKELDLLQSDLRQHTIEAHGPGNYVLIRADLGSHIEVFSGFGEHGVSAERVAR